MKSKNTKKILCAVLLFLIIFTFAFAVFHHCDDCLNCPACDYLKTLSLFNLLLVNLFSAFVKLINSAITTVVKHYSNISIYTSVRMIC